VTIEAAYLDYLATLRQQVRTMTAAAHGTSRVRSSRVCLQAWPPSLHDVAPAACQLPLGHSSRHLHRPRGGTAAIEWR
jgi:hypothetical protein